MLEKRLPVLVILVLFALTALCGCSGGGSSVGSGVNISTPESSVYELLESWQATQTSGVSLEGGQSLIQQTTASATRYIRFKDLAGEEWLLQFNNVVYLSSSIAQVHTSYQSLDANRGGLKLLFTMINDQGLWYLENIEVTEVPIVVVTGTGVKGVISDETTNLPVSGVLVEIYNQSTGTIAGKATTDATGFYSILELVPGTYYMVIERDGFAAKTISGIIVG
ncbi:MAG TPA: hypothetical protein DCG57_08855 [Candidatus Riflebacteria bacterium]|jgi:hypothetical protein|nr:hypothetical protein [Candidatus Riflebacteria bacterium]